MQTMTDDQIIDLLGGTKAVADILSISPPAVCVWRKRGIPQDKLLYLAAMLEEKTAGKLSRKKLFPADWFIVWPELRKNT
jgi:DNA-binding transcriptional regulator YdaS (Cro superfamily)